MAKRSSWRCPWTPYSGEDSVCVLPPSAGASVLPLHPTTHQGQVPSTCLPGHTPALQELLVGGEQGRSQQENKGPRFTALSGPRPLWAPGWQAGVESSGLGVKCGSPGEPGSILPSLLCVRAR